MNFGESLFVARVTAGLETDICELLKKLYDAEAWVETHRTIFFRAAHLTAVNLLTCPFVDDLFFFCGSFSTIDHTRASLSKLSEQASRLSVKKILPLLSFRVKKISSYSLTASFVGRRNYTRWEIADAVKSALISDPAISYIDSHDEQSILPDLHIRIHLYDDKGFVAIRVSEKPLYKRSYKTAHLPGSLNPPVAAFMVALAKLSAGDTLIDPVAGNGTIAIEATRARDDIFAIGVDRSESACLSMQENARTTDRFTVLQGDVLSLGIGAQSVAAIVADLPWGKQTKLINEEQDICLDYLLIIKECQRILIPSGRIVLLTDEKQLIEDAITAAGLKRERCIQISLYGKHPAIYVLRN